MKTKIFWLLCLFVVSTSSFAQSKKEQLEILLQRVDSLNDVLSTQAMAINQKSLEIENLNKLSVNNEAEIKKLKNENSEYLNKILALTSANIELTNQFQIAQNQINNLEKKADSLSEIISISGINILNLTSFSSIPDYRAGCVCLLSESLEKFNTDSYLFFYDYSSTCLISINNELVFLRFNSEGVFNNESYTVYIQNKVILKDAYGTQTISAEMVIIDKNGNILKKNVFGECGC